MKQTFYYTLRKRWLHVGRVGLYLLLLLLIILLYALWFYEADPDPADLFLRLRPILIAYAGALLVSLTLNFFIMRALHFELDEASISMDSIGFSKVTIPADEISEIRQSSFGHLEIKATSPERVIRMVPTYFEPEAYQTIRQKLESWQAFTVAPPSEKMKLWRNLGLLLIFLLTFPFFFTSPIRSVKAIPFLILFGGIVYGVLNQEENADRFWLRRILYAVLALGVLVLIIAIFVEG